MTHSFFLLILYYQITNCFKNQTTCSCTRSSSQWHSIGDHQSHSVSLIQLYFCSITFITQLNQIQNQSSPVTHLANCWILSGQSQDEDTVCLAYAALRPRRHKNVALVQNHSMDVLLLSQPTRQTILVNARSRTKTRPVDGGWRRKQK